MTPVETQHVLGRDRDEARERVRPKERRSKQDADADAGNVRACRMWPPPVGDAAHRELGPNRPDDGQRRSLVPLENPKGEMRGHENGCDEDRRKEPIVDLHSASLMRWSVSI